MKLLPSLVIALAAIPTALAVDQKKSAIVYFDDPSTPDSVIDKAKEVIVQAGGKITHVYSIIKLVGPSDFSLTSVNPFKQGLCGCRARKGTANSAIMGNGLLYES
jgi:hypothetical protein